MVLILKLLFKICCFIFFFLQETFFEKCQERILVIWTKISINKNQNYIPNDFIFSSFSAHRNFLISPRAVENFILFLHFRKITGISVSRMYVKILGYSYDLNNCTIFFFQGRHKKWNKLNRFVSIRVPKFYGIYNETRVHVRNWVKKYK
jgi:hypothetical protein